MEPRADGTPDAPAPRSRARFWAGLMAHAGAILNAPLALEETLGAIGRMLVPGVADSCAVHLIGEDGELALATLLFAAEPHYGVAAALRRYPPNPAAAYPPREVIERGEPALYGQIDDALLAAIARDAEHLALLRSLAVSSSLIVPLRVRGRAIGSLSLSTHEPGRRFAAPDVPPLRDLADRLALAIDNARLYGEAQARRRAEAALQASEDRFRVAQELSLDGFTVLRAVRDPAGAIVDFVWEYANPVAGALLRYPPEALIGQRLLELLPGNRGGLFEQYVRVVETGEPHDIELRYEADGIEGWFRNMAVRIDDGVAISFGDITPRKRAEERLRRLQEISADLAAALTPAQVVEVVVNHGLRSLGARAGLVVLLAPGGDSVRLIGSFGFPPEAVRAWSTIPLDAQVPLTEVIRAGAPIWLASAEERLRRYPHLADDPWVVEDEAWADLPLVIDGVPIGALGLSFAARRPFDPGDRAYIAALARHIAQGLERARLYEAALEARRAVELAGEQRDAMAAALSHDLKNPLTVVLAQATLLRRRLEAAGNLDAGAERSLGAIHAAAARMSLQIAELLDLARLRAGQPLQLQRMLVELVELVRRCAADLAGVGERHSVAVECEQAQIWGMFDAPRLERMLGNLLDNAIKYSPEGGAVRIRLTQLPGPTPQIAIAVADEGVGIPANELPYIFDLFRRAAEVSSRIGGAGVGLASVKQVAEAHGGSVAVASRAGAGTTVTITLPLSSAPAARERSTPDG